MRSNPLLVVVLLFLFEAAAGGGEEGLLERPSAVAALEVGGRLEHEQLAAVEDADAVGEGLGLGEVVRAEQDRRVVPGLELADEVLDLELRARVQAVVGSSRSSRTGDVSSARASATFCCMPRERFSMGLVAPRVRGSRPGRGSRDLATRLAPASCRRTAPRRRGSRRPTSS